MRIVSESTLSLFRGPGPCEFCGKACLVRQPHHAIVFRGMGSGTRLDHPFNIVALGGPFCCSCHDDAHGGRITRADFLAVIAAREGRLQSEIEAELSRLQRAPKEGREMAVRVVATKWKPQRPKRVNCANRDCDAVLSYTPDDVKDGAVECPKCGKPTRAKS